MVTDFNLKLGSTRNQTKRKMLAMEYSMEKWQEMLIIDVSRKE